jgi:hypothetical protein
MQNQTQAYLFKYCQKKYLMFGITETHFHKNYAACDCASFRMLRFSEEADLFYLKLITIDFLTMANIKDKNSYCFMPDLAYNPIVSYAVSP